MCGVSQSKAVLRKHGIVELNLQAMFEMNGSNANRENITSPVLIQKNERTTLQWPPESAREKDEAPLSVRRARVSRDLRSWFIFEPAPREINVSETP